jgi:thymidylate synthase (FAD)
MNIEIKLLHVTPLEILVGAIRQCYESFEKSDSGNYDSIWCLGPKDEALINRIIENQHHSCLEHISFNFQIKGISRLNLQELARHRIASLSVKSTRYTLTELKNEESFIDEDHFIHPYDFPRAAKYINFFTKQQQINVASIKALENLRLMINSGKYTNDELKYALPECYRLDMYWTINARSLRNFFSLRTTNRAHFEIREMANKIYDAVPTSYKFLFDGTVTKDR